MQYYLDFKFGDVKLTTIIHCMRVLSPYLVIREPHGVVTVTDTIKLWKKSQRERDASRQTDRQTKRRTERQRSVTYVMTPFVAVSMYLSSLLCTSLIQGDLSAQI